MNNLYRPAWIEIDTAAIRHNIGQVKKITGYPSTGICSIIKTNAYGHGIVDYCKTLIASKIDFFGVHSLDEARLLKDRINKKFKVLVLGCIYPYTGFGELVNDNNILPTISSLEELGCLNDAARRAQNNFVKDFHLKIDTGMARLGINMSDLNKVIDKLETFRNLRLTGVYTHCSSAYDIDYTLLQLDKFNSCIKKLRENGFRDFKAHAANSAVMLNYKQSHYDLARPGICLYGLSPVKDPDAMSLKPVLSWKSRIILTRKIKKGDQVSYGKTFIAKKDSNIAVISVGYGDGYSGSFSNRARVLINGRYAPVIGRVTMDFTMIDISDIKNAKIGDEAIIIGQSGGNSIRVEELAAIARKIKYEVVCGINSRLPRVYV